MVALHPEAMKRYLGQIEDLSAVPGSELPDAAISGIDRSAWSAFRNLVESVTGHPVPARLDLEVTGYLAALPEAPAPALGPDQGCGE
jgi:hypothetical protein